MKKFIIILTILSLAFGIEAQNSLTIGGTDFKVRCEDANMTAEIVDWDYKPEEHKYPINGYRKLKKWNKDEWLKIPSTVTLYGRQYTISKIGRCAFAGYTNIQYVEIPSTVTEIDEYAFFRSNVIDVQMPGSVRSIGKRAFGYCKQLKSIRLPRALDYTGENLYTESTDVVLSYSEPVQAKRVPSVTHIETPQVTEPQVASVSDIDQGIPHNPTNNDNTFVVIIANENYDNISDVEFALNDGRSFRNYCQMTLGIPSENIHLRENATYNHMKSELDWLSLVGNAFDGEANILFYYAGHGVPNNEIRHLICFLWMERPQMLLLAWLWRNYILN